MTLLLVAAVVFVLLHGVLADTETRLVIEVCRHGARAPLALFPKDTGSFSWQTVGGLGQLTPVGMRMHNLLGMELRRRYILDSPLLNATYKHDEVFIRSTDYDRTIQSVQSQLQGLFPSGPRLAAPQIRTAVPPLAIPNREQYIAQLGDNAVGGGAQPIPIHVVPKATDHLLRGNEVDVCPRIAQLYAETQASEEYRQLNNRYKWLWAVLANVTGMVDLNLFNTWAIDDVITAEKYQAVDHMPGLDQELVQEAVQLYGRSLAMHYAGAEIQSLSASEFFKELISKIDSHIESYLSGHSTPLKLAIYSGHDMTLTGLLSALGQFDSKNPPYASTLIVELHMEPVSALLRGKVRGLNAFSLNFLFNDAALTLPGCQRSLCPWPIVRSLLLSKTVPDIELACRTQPQGTASA